MMNDFEDLLKQQFTVQEDVADTTKPSAPSPGGQAVNMQRANGNCSIYDFFKSVGLISDHVLKKSHNATFMTDEKNHLLKDPDKITNDSYITYRLNNRKSTNEYKPTVREEIIEYGEDGRPGLVYGQSFDCLVQFNIFAANDLIANSVMEKFEELLIGYAGYLKENGVKEMYFKEQITDKEYNIFRETLSVRNIIYYVQIEKLTVIFNRDINDINFTEDTTASAGN